MLGEREDVCGGTYHSVSALGSSTGTFMGISILGDRVK